MDFTGNNVLGGLGDLGSLPTNLNFDTGLDGTSLGMDSFSLNPSLNGVNKVSLDKVVISGLIATKRNYLSPTHRRVEGTEAYKKMYAECIAEGITQYEVVKDTPDGERLVTSEVKDLQKEFSLAALKSLRPEIYKEIKENAYNITATERNAEFFIITDLEAVETKAISDELSETGKAIEDRAIAVSDDNTVSIMKPEQLIILAFETETKSINVVKFDHTKPELGAVNIGKMIPSAQEKTDAKGQPKLAYKAYWINKARQEVKKPGDFQELVRVFNRDYRGEKPALGFTIENRKFIKRMVPTIDEKELCLLKKAEAKQEGQKTLREREIIKYADQAATWKVLGVDEKLWGKINQSSSKAKPMQHADLEEIYAKGLKQYRNFQKLSN